MGNGDQPQGHRAQQHVQAQVRAGVENAGSALADVAPGHIDRLRVRVPRGASALQISQAVAQAAAKQKGRKR